MKSLRFPCFLLACFGGVGTAWAQPGWHHGPGLIHLPPVMEESVQAAGSPASEPTADSIAPKLLVLSTEVRPLSAVTPRGRPNLEDYGGPREGRFPPWAIRTVKPDLFAPKDAPRTRLEGPLPPNAADRDPADFGRYSARGTQ
jgi:hypothetical protein